MVAELVGALESDLDEALITPDTDLPVTLPVKCSGSLGNAGTPRRIDSFFTIASGPAQS